MCVRWGLRGRGGRGVGGTTLKHVAGVSDHSVELGGPKTKAYDRD